MNIQEYKGYNITGDNTYGMKEIKPLGKGSVHLSLRGKFTTAAAAMRSIDRYLQESSQNKEA